MTWLTWRQHRGEFAAMVVLLGIVCAILVTTGLSLHTSFIHDGAAGCINTAPGARGAQCDELIGQFLDQYQGVVNFIVPWTTLLPALVGVFIGAPLLSREFEHGTWQLAWTQAVPRTRWLAVKLMVLVVAVLVAAAAFTSVYTWWHNPVDRAQGRLTSDAFNMEGLAFAAHSLFAFGLGTFAGTFVRRSVPAMAAAFGGFLLVRLPVESWLRPHYLPPKILMFDPVTRSDVRIGGTGGEWILAKGIADASGRRLSTGESAAIVQDSARAHLDVPTYLHQQGLQRWYDYQPADRFWPFQFIEAGIYVTIAAVLLVFVVWRVRRRIM
ncbi:MAG TPA: transporter [Planosporangium sp.]|jgi:hypothetical protein|nr:transporter [Planosporangium sp.]